MVFFPALLNKMKHEQFTTYCTSHFESQLLLWNATPSTMKIYYDDDDDGCTSQNYPQFTRKNFVNTVPIANVKFRIP